MTCLQGVYDSDFLDDSALIKAFDNAINPIKVFIAHFLSFFVSHILRCYFGI